MCGATHPSQLGAQAENSAIDTLLQSINPIAEALSEKKASNKLPLRPSVLTDNIQGAFNQVHPTTLRDIMLQRCMPLYLTNWVTACLSQYAIELDFNRT